MQLPLTGLDGEERLTSSMIVVVSTRCPVKTRGASNGIHKAGRSRTFIVFILLCESLKMECRLPVGLPNPSDVGPIENPHHQTFPMIITRSNDFPCICG